MSDIVPPHHVLKELYQDVYKVHWSYLELEEGMQKIEEKQVLEGLLKNFLCMVPHNRKFFLPETFQVFKRTVTRMKDFSIVKMLNGFESISQYANNLFTKPWRKEYRAIKVYSGFFIHEIKSNLIDPEELFIAMGYKKAPNHTLVLDGEICPDQVMNVSRDAMTAYVECKIMNKIYSELTTSLKIACSWTDILTYREMHIGGVTDTVEAIKSMTQPDRCYQRDKAATTIDTSYYTSNNNHSSSNSVSQCNGSGGGVGYCPQMCSHQYVVPPPPPPVPVLHHHYHPEQSNYYAAPPVGQCLLHPGAVPMQPTYHQPVCDYLPPNHHPHPPPPPLPSSHHHNPPLPHSKSLEHYANDGNKGAPPSALHYHHRHSLDQATYETNYGRGGAGPHQKQQYYDPAMHPTGPIMDNGQMYGHQQQQQQQLHPAYNYSGNRYPLPYSISAQFNVNPEHSVIMPSNGNGNNGFPIQQQQCYDHHPKHCDSNSYPKPLIDFDCAYNPPKGVMTSSDDIDGPMMRQKTQTPRTSDFDSYEELFGDQNRPRNTIHSKPNGKGSLESWDYVYQSLDQQGGDKRTSAHHNVLRDLPGKELSESRRSISNGTKEKSKTMARHEAAQIREQISAKSELSDRRRPEVVVSQHQKSSSIGGNVTLKPSSSGHQRQLSDNSGQRSKPSTSSNYSARRTTSSQSADPATAKNEWSCRFCTFLNPDSRRICEMCSKSKDFFNPPESGGNTTCV